MELLESVVTFEYPGHFSMSMAEAALSNSIIEKSVDPTFQKMQLADLKVTIKELEARGDQASAAHLRDEIQRCGFEYAYTK